MTRKPRYLEWAAHALDVALTYTVLWDAVGGMPTEVTPAPLYRDPIFDGAADPVLVWNPQHKAWWMCYTQRRAKLSLPGVAWAHGTEIGVAESRDGGMTWDYIGQLPLWHPDPGYSFWAPDVILDDDGTYHFFVMPLAARRSSLQAAELEVQDGKLLCDCEKPFSIHLLPPGESEPRKTEKKP